MELIWRFFRKKGSQRTGNFRATAIEARRFFGRPVLSVGF